MEITTEDRAVDMIEEAYDLVIRVKPEADAALIGRAFLRDRLVVVASPHLTPQAQGSLVPAIVRGSLNESEAWQVTTLSGKSTITVKPVLSLASFVMVRDAVRMGSAPRACLCHLPAAI